MVENFQKLLRHLGEQHEREVGQLRLENAKLREQIAECHQPSKAARDSIISGYRSPCQIEAANKPSEGRTMPADPACGISAALRAQMRTNPSPRPTLQNPLAETPGLSYIHQQSMCMQARLLRLKCQLLDRRQRCLVQKFCRSTAAMQERPEPVSVAELLMVLRRESRDRFDQDRIGAMLMHFSALVDGGGPVNVENTENIKAASSCEAQMAFWDFVELMVAEDLCLRVGDEFEADVKDMQEILLRETPAVRNIDTIAVKVTQIQDSLQSFEITSLSHLDQIIAMLIPLCNWLGEFRGPESSDEVLMRYFRTHPQQATQRLGSLDQIRTLLTPLI